MAACDFPEELERPESEPPALEWAAPEWVLPELPVLEWELEGRVSEWAVTEWAVTERLADDPLCEEVAAFEAAEDVRAELPPLPGVDVPGASEPVGAAAGARAGAADLADTATGMEDKVSTESVAMGDRPA